jgi:hypothetical protein
MSRFKNSLPRSGAIPRVATATMGALIRGEEETAGVALTLFAALVSPAVVLFFFHLAYAYHVPVFCGMALALNAAAARQREPAL